MHESIVGGRLTRPARSASECKAATIGRGGAFERGWSPGFTEGIRASFARPECRRHPQDRRAPAATNHGISGFRTLGVALGQGQSLEQALAGKASVVEGVNTTRTAVALGERHGVELPIAREVANILFKQKPPRQAISELMERELKPESR